MKRFHIHSKFLPFANFGINSHPPSQYHHFPEMLSPGYCWFTKIFVIKREKNVSFFHSLGKKKLPNLQCTSHPQFCFLSRIQVGIKKDEFINWLKLKCFGNNAHMLTCRKFWKGDYFYKQWTEFYERGRWLCKHKIYIQIQPSMYIASYAFCIYLFSVKISNPTSNPNKTNNIHFDMRKQSMQLPDSWQNNWCT